MPLRPALDICQTLKEGEKLRANTIVRNVNHGGTAYGTGGVCGAAYEEVPFCFRPETSSQAVPAEHLVRVFAPPVGCWLARGSMED